MAMNIELVWRRPIVLKDGSKVNLIYTCDQSKLPPRPGIYVLARRWGQKTEPYYIGQANRLDRRIPQQLTYAPLMLGLKKAGTGRRILLVAEVKTKPGQRLKPVLAIAERAHIDAALAAGHELFNTQGTKTEKHAVRSKGTTRLHPFARCLYVKLR